MTAFVTCAPGVIRAACAARVAPVARVARVAPVLVMTVFVTCRRLRIRWRGTVMMLVVAVLAHVRRVL
ncbi:MAG TPA: hypothetical protein VK933_14700, partial [Longimicrobiales bacterium]|nr:hypothetical protein [Longimicrobiales bacterium]